MASNTALVTNTLVDQAAKATEADEALGLRSFLALSSLCEAVVLLDRLDVIYSPAVRPLQRLTAQLVEAGLLGTLTPSISRLDLAKVVSLLPQEVSDNLLIAGLRQPAGSAEELGDEQLDGRFVSQAGAVARVDYTVSLDELTAQLQRLVTYPSLGADGNTREYIARSNGYLIVAAANRRDYFPDFDRVLFAASMNRRLYRSMAVQVYERVAEALDVSFSSPQEFISDWTLDAQVPIPPITALVLSRASSPAEIPDVLLELRAEFAGYRSYFGEFKTAVQEAATLKERRQLQKKFASLLGEASGPDAEVVSMSEVLNLAEKGVQVAANPLAVTSYSGDLLRQPLDWIRRWWLRRPLTILFRMDGKLPRLDEYRGLIARLWGEDIQDELILEFTAHSRDVRRLLSGASQD